MLSHEVVTSSRIGEALRAARRAAGLSRKEAAKRAGLRVKELRRYERGALPASEVTIDRLFDVYDEDDPSSLVPPRTVAPVVLDAARLQVGEASATLKSQDPPRDEVLRGYLGLLYELRGKRPGTEIPLRTYDMDSLADALGADPDAIETRLVELMHVTREEAAAMRAAMIRRRLILPAAGIALGAGVFAGSMKLIDQSGSAGASHRAPVAATSNATPVAMSSATLTRAATTAPTNDGVVTPADGEALPSDSSALASTSPSTDAGAPAVATPPSTDAPPPAEVVEAPAHDVVDPPADDVVMQPVDEVTDPPVDEVGTPPIDEVVETPPSDEVETPPVDEVTDPPVDEVGPPPSDEATDPPSDDVETPPVDEVTDPPVDDVGTPPIDDDVKKPVECPPDLAQADEPQQLLSLQSLDSTQSRLSTGMRINTAKDDPAGLIVDQDGNCDPPPECPAPDGSQDVLSRLRDADFASESALDTDAAVDPKDEPRSLASVQTRLSTGLRVNSALDDATKESADTGDDCAAPDGKTIDELQRADQELQTILELLR